MNLAKLRDLEEWKLRKLQTIQRLLSIARDRSSILVMMRISLRVAIFLEPLFGTPSADWSDLDGKELAELLRPNGFLCHPL